MAALPLEFIARMRRWLGDEADAFFAALLQRDIGLRLNPRRGDVAALAARLPWPTRPVPWCEEGRFLQDEGLPLGTHPYHRAGLYYVQDPSAMAAAVLLDPQPGEWILDLAAAPGGKATHIAARMRGEGLLVANEISRRRAAILAMNVERMGVTNAMIANETPERLAARWAGLFDALLVDAPCSGEGTFVRDSQAIRDWSTATIAGNARRQRLILDRAAPLVRPGGRLLYGTCTFAPEENEGTIAAFLEAHPDFRIVPLPALPGMEGGRPDWIGAPGALRLAGRFWPHKTAGHGHFYALLRRDGESGALPARWEGQSVPGRIRRLYRESLEAALRIPPPEAGLYLSKDDHLYIVPMEPRHWEGLRILRPGWWVASLRHGKIGPDHALAMALAPDEAAARCDLAVDDPRLARYLQGGFWADEGPRGWVLITVEGFPLGWGKRGGGRLRSKYPMHLRR